ncbi:hypothetical protein [Streptomyces spectabilis]|uniref:Uncharacterized protein n=1 Tax=Streptomyces spectabilis TaxID=68270 RepID=A0A7W8EXR5_STRST|nr:hypothetical protein [Streptomyces spectabilis]MBB5109347.1 hypothetical protein [Streptomyces spectabilis]
MCLASGIAVVRAAPPRWPAAAPPAPTASFVLAAAENPERACAWVVGPARQHCPHRTRPRTTAPRGHGAGGWLLLPPAAAALALLILRRAGRR